MREVAAMILLIGCAFDVPLWLLIGGREDEAAVIAEWRLLACACAC